ncbi:hypothetical protein [Accumulibacter sp.]|uniref:hypothetical protein n=1 Tax=Accumulibacter sp. TaxID=2053492 RepID=UPI0028C50AAC|nr:hypothetical protein [Accumulibacter sp.]
MARPRRPEFVGALYHLTAGGDGGEDIYLADGDRQEFLDVLGEVWERFNRTYDRAGHAFQGRCKAILVKKDAQLLEFARYAVLKPVHARMFRTPGEWPWSSSRAMVGQAESAEWREIRQILAAFGETEGLAAEHCSRVSKIVKATRLAKAKCTG